MNAPHPLQQQLTSPGIQAPTLGDDDEINLQEYWDILVDSRWLIAAITALAVVLGSAYALIAKPVYESNLLIQVEDSAGSAKSFLGEAASLFDVKTPATAEIEIIRSRMVIGQAVDNTLLYITAKPRRFPVIGSWIARGAREPSTPGLLGVGGWVWGNESIQVRGFDVPEDLEGTRFRLTLLEGGRYEVSHPDIDVALQGSVGVPLEATTPEGQIRLLVASVLGKPGAQFSLVRASRLLTIEKLQEDLKLAEKGRQSGVIDATLRDDDRERLVAVLNEIGQQYVRQNIERKAAEAQKTLTFLDVQLPQFKKQLDQSEDAYSRYRNKQGTVALDEEAKLILGRSVELQSKLVEAQQKRVELTSRYTAQHPFVQTLDEQISGWNREIAALNARIKSLPTVQQDAVRLERDVKVNNELYQQLRNNALQLQLIREGKIGNVRLLDAAALPVEPVKPKRPLTIAFALAVGLVLGIAAAIARAAFFRGVRSPQDVEAQTGLNVYSTIPLSKSQVGLAKLAAAKAPGMHILAQVAPQDPAVEALRSLRTALQFAMLEASNNRVLITGGTPGIGKSFVSSNFAAVMASAGKRVLLIDADLRKGHLHQYFGMQREAGLSELIVGSIDEAKAIRRGVLPNLDFMPTGVLPPNPAEVVVSGSFAAVIEKLSAAYDLVIIDTAPVLVASDTLAIAGHAGTLLLVARAGQTHAGDLLESARRLAHSGRTVSGVLFNAMDLTRRHYGRYGYKYGGYNYAHAGYKYQMATSDGHQGSVKGRDA